jgi:hypothetical protein
MISRKCPYLKDKYGKVLPEFHCESRDVRMRSGCTTPPTLNLSSRYCVFSNIIPWEMTQ